MFKKKSRKSGKISTVHIDWTKKYIDQEPQYLMRQICVLQWEEIKTTHYFWGKRAQGRGGIRMLLYFPYWPESQKSYVFALTWYINLFFVGNITSELYSFPVNFFRSTGFVYIPPTVNSTQFAYIWVGRSCIKFLANDQLELRTTN